MMPREKIAIVGISCRFAKASSPEAYWERLASAQTAITTSERFGHAFHGGFLESVGDFDTSFFKIAPQEARCMDPQQRLLLEEAQLAIDDASLSVEILRRWNCGVFATGLPGDYKYLVGQDVKYRNSRFSFAGNATSSLSGRISYFYDFKGPSITIDTACSSALVALHSAWLHLTAGEVDAALVGGVSVFATDEIFQMAKTADMLSSGQSHAFDRCANGFVPAEGAAMLVLTTMEHAIKHKLRIYAVIEGIGTGHDGISNGLMAPNSDSQAKLISRVHDRHGIRPESLAFFESHGTATSLGDPLELLGISKALGGGMKDIYLGASKSIIGHTLVASGLASIIKVAKSFEHSEIPPLLLPHGSIDLKGFQANAMAVAYPADKPLVAINAFGFTGTNAHLVLRRPEAQVSTNHFQARRSFERKPYWISDSQIFEKDAGDSPGRDVLATLKARIAGIMGFAISDISDDASIRDLGLDSIAAIEILSPLKGGTLAPDELFALPSLRDVSVEIANRQRRDTALEPDSRHRDEGFLRLSRLVRTEAAGPQIKWLRGATRDRDILLLPPLNMDYKAFINQYPFLSRQGYTVHVPLYPGHRDNPIEEASIVDFPRLLEEIRDYVQGSLARLMVPVVGWSLGGCFAQALAQDTPELFDTMILVGTKTSFGGEFFDKTIEMQSELIPYKGELSVLFGPEGSLSEKISARMSLATLKHYFDFLVNFKSQSDMAKITAKTFVFVGDQDTVIKQKDMEAFLSIKDMTLKIYSGAGHFIPLTHAARFHRDLERILLG